MTEIHKYNVFLSYAFEDRNLAVTINALLQVKGFSSSFYDIDWSSQTSILEAFYNSAVCLLIIGSDQRLPWWDDCIGIAIDERLRSSHGEFRVVLIVFSNAADKLDVRQYLNVPFVSDDDIIHCEDSVIDADQLHELIVLIRGGRKRPKFLTDPGLRAWAKANHRAEQIILAGQFKTHGLHFASSRTKNRLRVDWVKLCYRFSPARVYRSLRNLLTKAPSQSSEEGNEVPLIGNVAAGQPIEAILTLDTISVPKDLQGRGRTFALRVCGESMIDENIQDGDIIIVASQGTAENGQLVVAMIDGNYVTVKKFYREADFIRLEAANPQVKPIFIKTPERIQIQGIVRGLIRKYDV